MQATPKPKPAPARPKPEVFTDTLLAVCAALEPLDADGRRRVLRAAAILFAVE